jgi:hypothetical protein
MGGMIRQGSVRSTTKNAHTQEKRTFFYENNRLYLFVAIL